VPHAVQINESISLLREEAPYEILTIT